MKNIFLLATLVLLLVSGCKKDELETIMQVNSYTQKCFAAAETTCMLVQTDEQIGSANWDYFYGRIEGFNYEPGYVYKLKVRKQKVNNPPADGSSIRYTLVEILSKQKVD